MSTSVNKNIVDRDLTYIAGATRNGQTRLCANTRSVHAPAASESCTQ